MKTSLLASAAAAALLIFLSASPARAQKGGPLSTYNFPSDENSRKEIARTMLHTLEVINDSLDPENENATQRLREIWRAKSRGAGPLRSFRTPMPARRR